MKIKINEARCILRRDNKLGKRVFNWEYPIDLKDSNIKEKDLYRTIVGIGRWNNTGEVFVCISQAEELIYIEKDIWLEITKSVKSARKKII